MLMNARATGFEVVGEDSVRVDLEIHSDDGLVGALTARVSVEEARRLVLAQEYEIEVRPARAR